MTEQNGGGSNGGCIEIFQQENCCVAYTLNNRQPVRCSYIGDQPLFYMDFDCADIDDEFAGEENDPFGIDAIEQGVTDLKNRIMALENSQAYESENSAVHVLDFIAEHKTICTEARENTPNNDLRLHAIERDLKSSRLGAAYLEAAKAHGVELAFSKHIEHALYDREAKTIFLHPEREENLQLLLAARELRRVWQHKNGALLHPLTFYPDQAILVNRAQQADLAVSMIRIAWELQLSGLKAPWQYLEESAYADLTRAFAREAYLDFRTLNNGEAASAAFENWFLSDRCKNEDRALIQNMLSDYQGYMFDSEQASRTVGGDLLVALGSMPFGNNYLAPFVGNILSDPLFTEVRDRSNANFLWFIKFERSFREAEQNLQTPSSIKDDTASGGVAIKKQMDGDYNEQATTVVPLPGMASRPASGNKRTANGAGKGANIVHFQLGAEKR